MTDIECKDIIGLLRSDFGSLWSCIKRGNTLEIITPYVYPNKEFVSVFITVRREKIIVSDGGALSDFIEASIDDVAFAEAAMSKFSDNWDIDKHVQGSKSERIFYFKACEKLNLVTSAIFDVCNFISSVASASELAITEEESQERESFRAQADKVIKLAAPKGIPVSYNRKFPEIPEASFSAVATGTSKLWLIIYVTGSSLKYFQLSLSNAIINFEFAQESPLKNQIAKKITLLNNQAIGYQPLQLQHRREKLENVTPDVLSWTERDKLKDLLAA